MSTDRNTDEVNLNYISKSIEKRFKSFLKICVSVFLFYKRKWLLFLVVLIIGAIAGYFVDTKLRYSKEYLQEIVVEPKYESKEYIYDFIYSIKNKLHDSLFLKKVNLDSSLLKNFKKVEIEPIIRATDVLDKLYKRYGDTQYFKQIIENYDPQTVDNEKYKNFFRYYRLTFVFSKKDPQNVIISKRILNYIGSNEYYEKIRNQSLKQTEKNLKKNKETLKFIDEYLDKIVKAPIQNDKDLIMISKESQIPTIANLLTEKQVLLGTIENQENILIFNTQLFNVVEIGDIILTPTKLFKKMIVVIPLFLIFLISIIFLFRQLPDRIIKYINS